MGCELSRNCADGLDTPPGPGYLVGMEESSFVVPEIFPPGADTDNMKRAFAAAMLRTPHDAFAAAKSITPDYGKASFIAHNWKFDPLVMAVMADIQSKLGADASLPSHAEYALLIYNDLQNVTDPDTKLKYYKLLGEVQGYVRKADDGPRVQINNYKVMAYPVAASDDAWERHAMEQQRNLVIDAQANV